MLTITPSHTKPHTHRQCFVCCTGTNTNKVYRRNCSRRRQTSRPTGLQCTQRLTVGMVAFRSCSSRKSRREIESFLLCELSRGSVLPAARNKGGLTMPTSRFRRKRSWEITRRLPLASCSECSMFNNCYVLVECVMRPNVVGSMRCRFSDARMPML